MEGKSAGWSTAGAAEWTFRDGRAAVVLIAESRLGLSGRIAPSGGRSR